MWGTERRITSGFGVPGFVLTEQENHNNALTTFLTSDPLTSDPLDLWLPWPLTPLTFERWGICILTAYSQKKGQVMLDGESDDCECKL